MPAPRQLLARPLSIVVVGVASLLCSASCSSSSSDGGGGGGGSGGDAADRDAAPPAVTHPACVAEPSGPTPPPSFGMRCGMGSNLPLCAKSGSPDCAGGACVWDANAVGDLRAYCTIACDPANAASCPPKFACKAQGCTESGPPNVCVRVAADVLPKRSCADVAPGRSAEIRDVFQARDGRLYAYAGVSSPSADAIFTRAPGETTWTSIWERPTTNVLVEHETLAANDAVYFTIGAGVLLRIAGTQVSEERYEACPPSGCKLRIKCM